MAKKTGTTSRPAASESATTSAESTASSTATPEQDSATSDRLNAIAEELGRFLGKAAAKAENLYEQRDTVLKSLSGIRDSASQLLERFGSGVSKGRNGGAKKATSTSKSSSTSTARRAKPAAPKGAKKK